MSRTLLQRLAKVIHALVTSRVSCHNTLHAGLPLKADWELLIGIGCLKWNKGASQAPVLFLHTIQSAHAYLWHGLGSGYLKGYLFLCVSAHADVKFGCSCLDALAVGGKEVVSEGRASSVLASRLWSVLPRSFAWCYLSPSDTRQRLPCLLRVQNLILVLCCRWLSV